MAILLSALGVVTGLAGTLMFALVAFVPRIGPRPLLRAMLWKTALALLSISLAGAGYGLHPTPGSLGTWIVTGLLAILTYVLFPPRIFVTLTSPGHVPASSADLGENAAIIGFAADGEACAWPMAVVVPRHLIQDRVGRTPVLVAY